MWDLDVRVSSEEDLTPKDWAFKAPRFEPNITDRNWWTDIWPLYRLCDLTEATAPLTICIDPFWTFEMRVDPASCHPFCTMLELPLTMGTLKARPLVCLCPAGASGAPAAQPAHSCSATVSAVKPNVTLRHHNPHHCASLPLCTGN